MTSRTDWRAWQYDRRTGETGEEYRFAAVIQVRFNAAAACF